MIPIQEYLNKIKWDDRLNPNEFYLYYYDRLEDKLKQIKFTDVKDWGKEFMVVEKDNEQVEIPLHRIKQVRRGKKLVWERPT